MNCIKLIPALFIFLLFFVSASDLCIADARTDGSKQPLNVGLLPYLSTNRLIDTYKAIKDYLQNTLNRPVRLITAPDFKTYIQRTIEGEYDIYHTAPHFAAYAESKASHRRLSRFTRMLDGNVIVRKGSPIKAVKELSGKVLATPDRLAVITMLGEMLVQENGMQPGKNITLRNAGSHVNAILSVTRGNADAAVVSAAIFERQPDSTKSKLRILTKTKQIPHTMFMANSTIAEEDYNAIKKALLAFTAEGPGSDFFKQTKRKNMSAISDQDMDSLQPFVKLLKTRLQ
ncbi:MAG: phosphate/phosphite/phosphonate ABC transporter substrate-binding protein [Gammaproteobacteria bacterium]|nr:phosphate/phosphite/phosphonate ABC transporter substrate-binding protein [Gammaproteobacteria bacterium]